MKATGTTATTEATPEPPATQPAEVHDTPGGSGRWSRFSRLLAAATRLSTSTRAVQEHLVATPPTVSGTVDRSAAVPPRLPTIPGVVDLEPRARGGMGIVYFGRDAALGRPVAVKVMWPSSLGSETACKRAKREALVLALVSHPNVVTVHAAGDSDGSPYLVMEWVDGPSLHDRLTRELPTPQQAARIVRDLATAVAVMHGVGVIHRDIKPDNVLLAGRHADDWERCVPKLADFGLAKPAEASRGITQDDAALGTPAYMAPEQTGLAEHLGKVGPAVDLHGLGSLAFAMVTGKPPYAAATPAASLHRAGHGDLAVPPSFRRLPRELQAIIETCLERQPARRYASASDLAADLDRFLSGRPVHARPLSPLARASRSLVRHPLRSAVIGLAATLMISLTGSFAWQAATIARATRSESQASSATTVATRSLERLTGDLVEKMVLQSSPEDSGHVAFLRDVREEFATWPLGDDAAAGLHFRLKGLRRVAELLFEVNEYDEALTCHRQSLAVLDTLATAAPTDPDLLKERLRSRQLERGCLYHLGRVDDAEASTRASLALMAAAPPNTPNRDVCLAQLTVELGVFLHEQQRHEEGSEELAKGLAEFRRLRAVDPADVELAVRESQALFSAHLLAYKAGRLDEGQEPLERLVTEIGNFLDEHPAETMTQVQRSALVKNVAFGHGQFARLAEQAGRLDEAIEQVRMKQNLCQAFLDGVPTDEVDPIHKEFVDASLHAATLLLQAGRDEEAVAAVERAEKTARFLYETRPGVFDSAYLIGWVLWMRGDIARKQDDIEIARSRLQEIITVLEPWMSKPACREVASTVIATAEEGLRALPMPGPVSQDAAPGRYAKSP